MPTPASTHSLFHLEQLFSPEQQLTVQAQGHNLAPIPRTTHQSFSSSIRVISIRSFPTRSWSGFIFWRRIQFIIIWEKGVFIILYKVKQEVDYNFTCNRISNGSSQIYSLRPLLPPAPDCPPPRVCIVPRPNLSPQRRPGKTEQPLVEKKEVFNILYIEIQEDDDDPTWPILWIKQRFLLRICLFAFTLPTNINFMFFNISLGCFIFFFSTTK